MSIDSLYPYGFRRIGSLLAGVLFLTCSAGNALAQDEDEEEVDEITVTGTQIKGANISEALAVSVIKSEDIELLGVESGDELLDLIPEMGQNFFSESDTAGGVNAARGDVGAINMRNLGTGNTLVLLNGRRMVNMATYQTEAVGGSFAPVNSVNSNHLPVYGVERFEVLRDGASAIYGADAVAGVLNTVLKDDFEGFTIRARYSDYDNLPRNDEALSIEWGQAFNGGATHVGIFARHYRRDRVNSMDDKRWADSDFRNRFPENSPFRDDDDVFDEFRNDSANSYWGRSDVIPSLPSSHSLRQNDIVDSSGEFELFPVDDPDCVYPEGSHVANVTPNAIIDLGNGNCMREDSTSRGVRYNINGDGAGRDLLSDLERTTVYGYVNHEMDSGLEFFSDFYFYDSTTERINDSNIDLSAVPLRIGASNYYNPLGPIGSPNRLPDLIIGTDVPAEGYELNMDLYRFDERPRITDNDGDAFRIVAGLRGTAGYWDWESAVTYSEATRDEVTHNRLSNTLITQALFDPTPNAYNPFSAGVDSNIEQAYIDVYRNGETDLEMFDVKFSNPELFEMLAGPVGFLIGYEYRKESFKDDRDPRLDGTIRFMRDTDGDGILDTEGDFDSCDPLDPEVTGCSDSGFDTYPLTSDVVRSSPTPDGAGERTTNSLFSELQIPLLDTLDLQLALRYEDFDDIGDTTVGKIAFGWRPFEQVLFRGSWSEAFRAPNLITINEEFIARSNTLDDWGCFYGVDQGTVPSSTYSSCDYGIQRQATGSKELKPEDSTNTSVGVVWEPAEDLTFTLDFWTIKKKNTIGLFGEENHMLYDLVLRLEEGTGGATVGDLSACDSVQGNPEVVRRDFEGSDTVAQGFLDAGLCPLGEVDYVTDRYTNLDTRKLEGFDIGIYYDLETSFGEFYFRYNGSYYEVFEQEADSPLSNAIQEAKEADSTITYPIRGLGDLLGIDGNQEDRHTASVSWVYGDWSAGVTAFRISSFDEILSSGVAWKVPAMTTYNTKVDYRFDVSDVDMRVRLGINNITDERAPLADESFGFFKDAHRDWGMNWYLDLKVSF